MAQNGEFEQSGGFCGDCYYTLRSKRQTNHKGAGEAYMGWRLLHFLKKYQNSHPQARESGHILYKSGAIYNLSGKNS